jgi:hypothetical protein
MKSKQKNAKTFQSKIERFLVRNRDNTPPMPGQVKISLGHVTYGAPDRSRFKSQSRRVFQQIHILAER